MHPHRSRKILSILRRPWSGAVALLLAAAACAPDALLSPANARLDEGPQPSITVTPGTALVGDTGVVLTIRGSGFTQLSYVWIRPGPPVTTTLVNDSTLTARIEGQLQWPGSYQVSVEDEWGGTGDPATFEVAYPVPVITRMTPDWCETGGDCGTVTVEGRNFMPDMQILWNGSTVNSMYVSDTRVTFNLDPYYLQWPDLAQITALNPQPSAGPSAPVVFQVGSRFMLHTAGATAGSAGFELEVYGEGFSYGAVVYWNGSPRDTWVHNARRLSAYITAADVAAAGEGVVTLSHWSLNGGQPFRVGAVTVRPLPSPAPPQTLALDLPVRDVAWSPFTERLYATVYSGPMAGHLAVIDPVNGAVVDYMWMGDGPRYLAITEDGRYLWVGVDGENKVRRVNLQYGYPDFEVQLDPGTVAEDLAAVPGKPYLVAVSRRNTSGSPAHAGVAVYYAYGGGALPLTTAAGVGSNVIEFGARGSTLYGLDNETTDNRIRTMSVDDGGVSVTATGWSLGMPLYADMVFAGGRLYTSKGPVIDTGYNDWAGYFNNLQGAVRPDLETGRAFFLGDDAIRVADINTFALLATLPVAPLQSEDPATQRRHLVRWGADGLAWHDADELFLLRNPIVAP